MVDAPRLNHFLDEAQELFPAAIALRRRIHAKPELGLHLPLTTRRYSKDCRVSMSRSLAASRHPVSWCR